MSLAATLTVSGVAAAPTGREQAEAKQLFERGKEAMSVGRFAEAREHFQRSVELVPKASAAFNLAVALRGMGLPKEAEQVLAQMLAGKYGKLPKERQSQVAQLRREAERDISTLKVTMSGAPQAQLRVDGAQVGTIASGKPLAIKVNPGERVLTLSARLRTPVEQRVTLAPGKSASVEITLKLSEAARRSTLMLVAKDPSHELEIVGVARGRGRLERKLKPGTYQLRLHSPQGDRESQITLEPATRHRIELSPERDTLFDSPWFWVAAGTVTVGAAVGGYFLLRPREEEPVSDPTFGVVETLRVGSF